MATRSLSKTHLNTLNEPLHNKQIDIEIFDLLLDTEITCGKLAIGKCKKYKADNCLLSEMLHMQLKLPAGGYHTGVKYEQLFAIFPLKVACTCKSNFFPRTKSKILTPCCCNELSYI